MKTILLLSFLALTSCATITHGPRQQIPINTSPQGAYVKLTTPTTKVVGFLGASTNVLWEA